MTFEDLEQHRRRREELDKAEKRLKRLYDKAWPGAQNLDGMPRASGVKDKVGDLGAEIGDYETSVEALREEVRASADRVERFIQTIDNRDVRLILRIRFLRNYPWKEVADYCGELDTARSVSQVVYDFFKDSGGKTV